MARHYKKLRLKRVPIAKVKIYIRNYTRRTAGFGRVQFYSIQLSSSFFLSLFPIKGLCLRKQWF